MLAMRTMRSEEPNDARKVCITRDWSRGAIATHASNEKIETDIAGAGMGAATSPAARSWWRGRGEGGGERGEIALLGGRGEARYVDGSIFL
jgi:hypothetical protein